MEYKYGKFQLLYYIKNIVKLEENIRTDIYFKCPRI